MSSPETTPKINFKFTPDKVSSEDSSSDEDQIEAMDTVVNPNQIKIPLLADKKSSKVIDDRLAKKQAITSRKAGHRKSFIGFSFQSGANSKLYYIVKC